MTRQFEFFDSDDGAPKRGPTFPEVFRYQPELIMASDEAALLARVCELPFRDFEFHGHTGKRHVVSFGWHYDSSARSLDRADDVPKFLRELRRPAGEYADLDPEALQHVLVTEYGASAAIGSIEASKRFSAAWSVGNDRYESPGAGNCTARWPAPCRPRAGAEPAQNPSPNVTTTGAAMRMAPAKRT